MDATQQIEHSFFGEVDDSDEEHEDGEGKGQREQLAVLKVFKNNHIPETEVPLYQGENVLGRDPSSCSVPLQARSVSGRHAIISVSVFGPNDRQAHSEATEALLWDLGSLNGTRKGRLKLTPHVRYALTDGDGLVLADLPCQYVSLKNADMFKADNGREKAKGPTSASGGSERGTGKGAENGGRKNALPPVPVWTEEAKGAESVQTTPKKPERTLVPESDSDSDGERHGRRDRKRIVVSDSGSSDLSSPTCSTFLTPANKVIPESEDESSITPSSTLKGRFLKTGNHTEVSSDSPKPDQLLFNIDSDTDVEDEEEEMKKDAPKTLTAEVDAATPADLHMDSDTDVEDDDVEKTKSDPEVLGEPAKQDAVNPAVLNMDSDTDVEDNEPVKTATTTVLSGVEVSLEEKKDTDSSSGQLHLESDTDVEDEDDVPRIQDSKPPTTHVAEFNLNSDTDVEEDEDETTKGNEAESKDLEPKPVDSVQVPDVKMSHDQSDIDTDVEDDDTEIRTPATAEVTAKSPTRSQNQTADASSTNALPGGPAQDEAPFRLDSDTDVEEDEEKMEGKEQKCGESAVQIVHSSTPKGVSGEELETQAFLSPSQLFKRPGLPSLLHPSVSPGGISHPDDDFAVAETQSFVCDAAQADATLDETPESLDGPEPRHSHGASSFQLSLSDSSHQLPEAAEHDGEPAEEEWQLQATQLYAMKNSEGSTKAGEMQQDLDSTQAYVCATGQEEEEEEKEDGGKEEEEQETEPLDTQSHSSIHTAETQLIKPRALNEDNRDRDTNEKVVASEPEMKAEEDAGDEMQVDSHLSTADTLLLVRSPRQEELTQPYAFLTAQIQKDHEETEKEEHESRDLEDREDEGERAQEEGRRGMDEENELTREEEKKERGENETVENDHEVDEAQTQPSEAEPIAETLPMCEEEEGQEEERINERRSSRGTQPAHIESTQPLEPDDLTRVAIAETLPMCEEEDEQDEEQLNEPCSSRGTHPAQVESTQPLESDDHTHVAIAETLPMCEEEEGQEEEKNKPRNSRRPGRKRLTVKVETKQPVESDKVTRVSVAETQPMSEDDEEGQEEEQQSETTSTRRSSTRRRGAKTKPHVATPETLPLCEEEEAHEEAPPSEAVSGRKSRRGRQTAKVETARAVEPDSTTETVKVEEEEEVQDSRRNLRGRAASGKGKGRGRAAAEKEKRGKRGKREQDEDSEEEVERGNKGRGRKSLRLKSKDDDKARLELMEAGKEEMDHVKKQEEEEERKRLQMEKKEEARDQLEREESARLEKERVEREECEKMERLEREKKETEEKEMKEREEMERLEREKQLEKERREQEEKDRLEKERIEKENREKEEKERLEREMREKQELEKERKKQEEKDRLEKEKMDRKEKKEQEKKSREEKEKQEQEMKQKESKDDTEDMEKEKRPAPGKRKVGLQRKGRKSKKEEDQELEEGTKEGLETEQELMQKEECEEGNSKKQEDEQADSDSKTKRGRRTTRKSVAPPAGAEDEGGPAKRTRSRSNSSNSVCSEQSAQDSLNGGRGELRRTAQEQKDTGRPSGRRRTTTTTAPSSEKEEIKQASNTRSNSRSSERSSSSAATPSRGRGRKRSVKVEETEEEEEREQLAPVGRGRGRGKGRGGKHLGGNDIKEETAEKEKPEVMAVAEDGVTCQSSSRGRKRGVDVSMPMEETPQPTPKTPRRSLAGQTHKVLFTGVVDEDGEKVVVRLGGGLAKGVADMTHLVTDKVRRTVKFLCAVARGVPIVTPDWLSKCGKAGSFLSPNGFLVKDIEQEKRFNFSLQEALRVASSQPLLQGYEIHVTPSVKPEPAHMKEIITCCGARFLPKMPSAHKAQTVVVVSCEEDRAVCEKARSLSFPVVSAEFLLTGILQQKVDLQTHVLSLSPAAAATKPASRSRGK